MRDRAQVVVIGGGVGGASIAWHLADRGWTDVLLLERHEITSGSTFHSAGLVGQLRGSLPLTRMMMHSVDTYRRLEREAADSGLSPGWQEVGSMRIASTPARLDEIRRQHGWAKTFGLPMELLSPREAGELFPLMSRAGVLGAIYLPTDGHLDPSGLTHAFVGGARGRGTEVATGVRVTGLGVRRGRISVVETDHGPVEAEIVVVACGMYTPQVTALAGVHVPIIPMAHQYLITKPIDGATQALPSLRDPDNLVYFRRESGGLIVGGYERDPAPWAVADGPPADFNNRLLPEDWDRFAPLMEAACGRVPAVEGAEIVQLLNGPEGFTPDNEFILGESEVHGLFVAAGFCAHGVAGAGGVGRAIAEWIVDGEPSFDTWKMDIRRFGAQYRSRPYALARTVEVYSTYYDIHYPNEERQAGRPLRLSPTYPRLGALGASFGEKGGWERPNWFEPNARLGDAGLRPRGWAGEHWSAAIGAEAVACRETAALFDETSFAKLEVEGDVRFLQRLCGNDVDRPVGSITYTQMLNARGGIECDFTVSRLAENRFSIVTGTAFGNHDLGWIRKQQDKLPEGDGVVIRDVTSAFACLGLWGPAARAILAPLTDAELTNDAFPYMTWQNISVGSVPVRAMRVTYVGELGWELYCPTEYGAALWDTIWDAGQAHGLRAAGYRAIDALRLEKGYRAWAADITPEDTPLEAGLGFAVRLGKETPFVGQEALRRQKQTGVSRRLVCLVLGDPRAVALGSEPVRHRADILGRVTSGGYGFTTGASIAYAYVPTGLADVGTELDVEMFGEWIAATVSAEPLWDPTGTRIRA